MMKENKGFTIPELLAVIVILGILFTTATFSYNRISENVKKKTYDSKINLIKTKAIDYANDYDITAETISVAKLIDEGYLDRENDTESNEKISNPLGGYLDCYKVDIARNLDDYDVSVNEDNSCAIANLDNISNKIDVYVYEGQNNAITNYNSSIGKNNESKWTNKDIYLYLDPNTVKSNIKSITWTLNSKSETKNASSNIIKRVTADTSYANIYKVESVFLLNTYVYVKIDTDDGLLTKKVLVKIDKEAPTVALEVNSQFEKFDNNSQKSTKVVKFIGSDGSGSGIGYAIGSKTYGYYLTNDPNKRPNKDDFNVTVEDSFKKVTANGTYYAYAIDQAGNISKEAESISVTNVTYDGPECLYPTNNDTWINHDYTFRYGCVKGVGTGCSYEPKSHTVSEEGYQMKNDFTWEAIDNVGNKTQCKTKVIMKVDKTAPSCEILVDGTAGKNGWYTSDVSLTLKCSDSLSGMESIGLSTNPETDLNGQTTAKITTETDGITYYGYAEDVAGNITKISKVIKIVKTPPTCTLSVSGQNNGVGDSVCTYDEAAYNACIAKYTGFWASIKKSTCKTQATTCVKTNVWYTGDATVTMNTTGSFIASKIIKAPKETTTSGTYILNYDTNSITVNGTVENQAGLTNTCSTKLRRDTNPPTASLSMDGGDTCNYTVKYKTRTKRVNANTNRTYYSTQSHTITIACTDWDKNGYSNSNTLNSYLKKLSPDFYSRTSIDGPTYNPPLSTATVKLKCSDSLSGMGTYAIDGTTGETYNLNGTTSSNFSNSSSGYLPGYSGYRPSTGYRPGFGGYLPGSSGTSTVLPTKTLTGVCTDVAGNKTTVSQTFEKYESQEEKEDCDHYFSKSDCDGGHNQCASSSGSCSTGKEASCDYKDCSEGSSDCSKPESQKDCDTYTVGENKWRVK